MKLALIINPDAGKVPKYISALTYWAEKFGIPYLVAFAPDQVAQFLVENHGKGIKHFGIIGGDGTINRVVESAVQTGLLQKIILILFGGGTMNLVRNWQGWRSNPVKLLKKLQKKWMNLKIIQTPVLQIKQGEKSWCGFVVNIGAIARIINSIYNLDKHSFVDAFATIIKSIIGAFTSWLNWPKGYKRLYERLQLELIIDGIKTRQSKTLGLMASIPNQLILKVKPFKKHIRFGDQIHLLSHNLFAWVVVLTLPFIAFRLVPTINPIMINQPCHSIQVCCQEEEANIDGELIKIIPGIPIEIVKGHYVNFAII